MKIRPIAIWIVLMLLASCDETTEYYPDEPVVDYQSFGLYFSEDALGNQVIMGRLTFDFTDGDGNLGLHSTDTMSYNFYLQIYDLQGYDFVQIPESEGGVLKYRIPLLLKQPTKGTMDLDISYPVIVHDTIFYTFYIVDRDSNQSNTDTTDVIVLSGIEFEETETEE